MTGKHIRKYFHSHESSSTSVVPQNAIKSSAGQQKVNSLCLFPLNFKSERLESFPRFIIHTFLISHLLCQVQTGLELQALLSQRKRPLVGFQPSWKFAEVTFLAIVQKSRIMRNFNS